jgi:Ran GTPase-activating protein (RanGAP) involved in mRNA processing and transport
MNEKKIKISDLKIIQEEFQNNKESQEINLSNKKIKVENFKQLKEELSKKKNLTCLNLSNNNLTEREIYFLAKAVLNKNKKIKILDLSWNNLENIGVFKFHYHRYPLYWNS